jgi:hypothetical protein
MKAIHLTAGFALFLLPLTTASAATSTLQSPPVIGAPTGEADVPGDFNEDGNPDLLFQNSASGDLQAWLLDRTKPAERVAVVGDGDPMIVASGTDDFDGDNRTDILMWNPPTGNLVIWYMDGTRLVRKSSLNLGLAEYAPVSVVDWNRDGHPDILFQRRKGGDIFVVLLQGETVIAKQPIDIPTADRNVNWRVLGTGDFNRDGAADLVLFHTGANGSRDVADDTLAVALMNGTGTGRIQVVTKLTDRNWQVRAVADFTGDGWPDLFFENYATGETGAWEMEGLKIGRQYVVTGPAQENRGWHLVGPR